ncbi:FecR domain-containing protein [Pseudomonas costantinii]|uniref:FecR domain-containing protein n=1 Tax=Pseudomonas costantinii TaxID=168469 RepID=UPI0015A2F30F|nr:FecR domain-containing protein [Pseudomonas costantinii]NVZ68005.1 FecR domain-containing protein [Pseudomonas costantinii]
MSPSIDPLILGEAADWLVQLQSGSATDEDRRAIAQWQSRSAQHAQAWQRAEAILGDFDSVPGAIAGDTLKRLGRKKSLGRRQALGLMLLAGPTTWLAYRHMPWKQWAADQHTAIGEQRNLTLPDGTRLLINTGSSLNITFTRHVRRIELLLGEVMVTTAKDPAPTHRPFIVQTRHGTARALGTHFSVRVGEQRSRVAVLEGSVEMLPEYVIRGVILKAGEQGAFGRDSVAAVEPLDVSATTWEKGMLLAQQMRLADLLQELGRYRSGVLRCHHSVAGLSVSGAFPLRDTDASLRLLQETLPVKVSSLTGYWVTVEPR